ncbi:neutral zinc metallopeptidase [Kribbella sancticallisti]
MADEPGAKPGPKAGHFLPGGAGDVTPADPAAKDEQPKYASSVPLTAPTPRLGAGAEAPSGPPVLSGSRLGPPPPGDRAAAAFQARYQPVPVPFEPRKKSKALIAGIVVGALVVVAGGIFGATRVLRSYDEFVANPLGTPSVQQDQPIGVPTDEPTSKPKSDHQVTKENRLYAGGKLAPVACREPKYRPTSKDNVRSYYQALLVCHNKTWEPVVRAAGFDFRPPQLIIFDDGEETACGVQKEVSSYCPSGDGSVAMPWEDLLDKYTKNPALARVDMADALGYVYSVHVQNLTGILDAGGGLRDEAVTPALRLEQERRLALQATCLSSVFLGAAKASFPVTGNLLEEWTWRSKNSGDDIAKGTVRDHGSSASVRLWMTKGFSTANPAACNTFVAAAAEVR